MKKETLLLSLFLFCSTIGFAQKETKEEIEQEKVETLATKGINIRTNVAYWMLLTPSLGAEYRFNENWGFIVDGAYAHWSWKDDSRRHRIWQVKPRVRTYLSALKDSYVGLEYNVGQYSLNWSGTGREANFMGSSLAIGHQFFAGKKVLVDLGVSFGYLRLSDRLEYERIGNKDVITARKKDKNYWGPTGLSMTIVWRIF